MNVVIQGFGPHIRIKTTDSKATVKVFNGTNIVEVPLAETTDLSFAPAA
jgi:hypothetical protein